MSEEIKLKRCPFCGCVANLVVFADDTWEAQCSNKWCRCHTAAESGKGQAILRWNKRQEQTKAVASVEVGEEKPRAAVYEGAKRAVAPCIDLLERNAGAMEIETVCAEGMKPKRAHEHDAGADLRASEYHSIGSGQVVMVPTGVRVSIPEGYFGLLAARSSLFGRGLLMANGVGIIDSGFTGEIKVPLFNAGNLPNIVMAGERIAQLVILPCELPTFRLVAKLEETERGEGGFGSTGVE